MKLSQEQIDQLLSDVGVFKMLLQAWLNKWDTIEEWIGNDLVWEDIEDLAELTRNELGIQEEK